MSKNSIAFATHDDMLFKVDDAIYSFSAPLIITLEIQSVELFAVDELNH